MPQMIVDSEECVIQPGHIDFKRPLWDAFEDVRAEFTARLIISTCTRMGRWFPIPEAMVDQKSGEISWDWLLKRGWIVRKDGCIWVTYGFVARCYGASPKIPARKQRSQDLIAKVG